MLRNIEERGRVVALWSNAGGSGRRRVDIDIGVAVEKENVRTEERERLSHHVLHQLKEH